MLQDHPKVADKEARKVEMNLAQIENFQNFGEFQKRRYEMRPDGSPRPDRRNLNDIDHGKLNGTRIRTRESFNNTRSQPELISARSSARTNSARSGPVTGHQLRSETENFAKVKF